MLRTSDVRANPRRGVVLLVVISLLTLFAVLGLSFVLYANATAEGSRLFREAESESQPDVDPELLFSLFLGQLLYDAPDDATGVFSALRGHSLARGMFGLSYDLAELNDPSGTRIAAKNAVPFNGTGRLRYTHKDPGLPRWMLNQDDYKLINYTFFPTDGFLRDPERPGWRRDLQVGTAPYVGAWNAPYTYPDLNNMFLAAMKADGSVLLPSFHRPWAGFGDLWTPNPSTGKLEPNPKWFQKGPGAEVFKYLVLRPRPADHAGFPPPADPGGDVKNLIGYPGTLLPDGTYANNDSIWLDLDAPVMRAPDGRKFKPLFAPLILDLDNRVNLNVHGNPRLAVPFGPERPHFSNQGWGPWEVNPARLIADPVDPQKAAEWSHMVTGTKAPDQAGRMGRSPTGYGTAPSAPQGRIYSPTDLDGVDDRTGLGSEALRLPGMLPSWPWQCFPSVPPGYGNGSPLERLQHPMSAAPFRSTANNYVLPLSNMEALLRYGDTGSPALTSELFRLAPFNFGDPRDPESIRRRNLVTVHSCDVDRPGVIPFFWGTGLDQYLQFPTGDEIQAPSGGRVPYPRADQPFWDLLVESEFKSGNAPRDLRAADVLTVLRRLDLNRYLPPYPAPDSTGVITKQLDFQVAQRARQIFAEEIFERLWRLTGAGNPAQPAYRFMPQRWDAFRWLAQLAVNIVDFIDPDDYMTPFQWAPALLPPFGPAAEWVFGTELPRLVINEVYAQYDNHKLGIVSRIGQSPHATSYAVSFWVELHNPLARDPSLSDGGAAVLHNGTFPVYQLALCGPNQRLRRRDNVLGIPDDVRLLVGDYSRGNQRAVVLPSDGQYADPSGTNNGFFVIGPDLAAGNLLLPQVSPPHLPVSYATPGMTYKHPAAWGMQQHTVVLRRLACPHLPPSNTNPYVTVDYLSQVSANDGRIFDHEGKWDPPPHPLRNSYGKEQPYAATVVKAQSPQAWPDVPLDLLMPQHSFFQHNVASNTPGPNWPLRPPPGNLYPPFDWLVHLDRPLISPMELLHVSAYKPRELTQQFVQGVEPNLQKNKHRAPWFDEHVPSGSLTRPSLRLYRALEFFTTGHLAQDMRAAVTPQGRPLTATVAGNGSVFPLAMAGPTKSGGTWSIDRFSSVLVRSGAGEEIVRVEELLFNAQRAPVGFRANFLRPHSGTLQLMPSRLSDRVPGKININTIWDPEPFLALCDPQPANVFSNVSEVRDMFSNLAGKRTPGLNAGVIGENDRPFLGMAVGNAASRADPIYQGLYPNDDAMVFPNGSGLEDTFFRSMNLSDVLTDTRLLHVTNGDHTYFQNQLLHKVFNHLTTRSNVFAVWLTVGFFEVTDDTSRPVKLGAELGVAEGRQQRHRMFAIVDRSVMTANPGPQPRFRLQTGGPANAWTTGPVVPYYSIIE